MPTSPAGRALTEAHRLAQVRLGATVVAQVLPTFDMLDISDLDGSAPSWLRVNQTVVAAGKRQSARMTAAYYQAFRRHETGGKFVPKVIEAVDHKQLSVALLVTGVYNLKRAIGRGVDVARATDVAKASSAGAAMRLALQGGRETLTQAVQDDKRAKGYERVTSGNPCDFCQMLADRGAVYGADSVDFEAHDHCSCSGEPVFS